MKLRPTRRDGHETRTRLLRAARETFEERGYHRTSVAEICRRCAVANGTFYRYFNNKDEVFLLLAERLGEQLEQALAGSLQAGQTISEKIYRSQAVFYDYVKHNRALYQIFREAEFIHLDLPVQTYHRLARQLEQHLLPSDDPAVVVGDIARSAVPFAILGIANMIAMKYIIWDDRAVPPDIVQATADFICRGLSPDELSRPIMTGALSSDRDPAVTEAGFNYDAAGLTEGERTRRRLLQAAELSFGEQGFFSTQIVDITRRAGVAQGTFYVHFPGKVEILRELVDDISRRLRAGLRAGVAAVGSGVGVTAPGSEEGADRRHIEIAGLATFLRWLDGRDGIYRIVREAEFVDESIATSYYDRLVKGYVQSLRAAITKAEVRPLPTDALAYCLLGIGHISGLRWVLWPKASPDLVPADMREVVQGLSTFMLYGVEGVRAGMKAPF